MTEKDTKHTAGPWKSKRENMERPNGELFARWQVGSMNADPWDIATLESFSEAVDAEQDANARLIAAAPELLEALKGMVERYASHDSGRADPNEPAAARAAIAKAETQ